MGEVGKGKQNFVFRRDNKCHEGINKEEEHDFSIEAITSRIQIKLYPQSSTKHDWLVPILMQKPVPNVHTQIQYTATDNFHILIMCTVAGTATGTRSGKTHNSQGS